MPAHPRSSPILTGALLAAALLAGGAHGQSPDVVKAQAGDWLVAADDGRPGCRIRLTTETTIGGMTATPALDCASRIPKLADVAAWRLSDGVVLADATRKPILVFTEDETAVLKTREGGPPTYYMFKPKAGVDRVPHASAVFGTWQMRRPNGPSICTVAFQDRPPKGGEESYALSLDSACDAAVRKLKLVSWRIEDVLLTLYGSDGESLRFEPTASGFEKIVGKGDRPLHLVRQP